MRNLKKILALVLALVMSFSVMTVASAEFKDADGINADFVDAVEVLNGLGVFKGIEDAEGNMNFDPTGKLTRAQAAAILYRIDTGDVTDSQVQIYSDWQKFSDVTSDKWFAGYVNYCANAEYILGYGDGTFGPDDYITGYQALALVLRAVGYDKNGEFSGDTWEFQTAKLANSLKVTANVDANKLGEHATRELVAELVFRTIKDLPQVTWTMLGGYNQYAYTSTPERPVLNPTIGWEQFGLPKNRAERNTIWGEPYTVWTRVVSGRTVEIATTMHMVAPIVEEYVALNDCYIYDISGLAGYVDVYENGVFNGVIDYLEDGTPVYNHTAAERFHVDPYSTTSKVGEQGTMIKVYEDRIVLKDTYLAQVTDVIKLKTDKAGHVQVYPALELQIYAAETLADTVANVTYISGNDYAEDDFVLLCYNEGINPATGKAFGAMEVRAPKTEKMTQTRIWWNAAQHTLDGNVYYDNVNFLKGNLAVDPALRDKDNAYYWFLDEHDNVMGNAAIITPDDPANYAVVLGAYWHSEPGKKAEARAVIQYLNATEPEIVTIASVDEKAMKYAGTYPSFDEDGNAEFDPVFNFHNGYVYTTYQYNLGTGYYLYTVEEGKTGLELTSVDEFVATARLEDGVSKVIAGQLYVDNDTVFYFYGAEGLTTITGYDNLVKDYTAYYVSYVLDENSKFASIVYVYYAEADKAPTVTPDDEYETKYVYFTNNAFSDQLGDRYYVAGVVDGTGSTDPLMFSETAFGSVDATEEVLETLVEMYTDMLVKVTTKNGLVISIAAAEADDSILTFDHPVDMYDVWTDSLFLTADEYEYRDGVLNVGDYAEVLNTNHKTLIINEDGVGVKVDEAELFDWLVDANIYVVYGDDNIIDTIFITPIETLTIANEAVMVAMMTNIVVNGLNAKSFAMSSKTYTVNDDAAAIIAEISAKVEASEAYNALTVILGQDVDYTVEILARDTAKNTINVKITVVAGGCTKTVEVKVSMKKPA